MNNEEHNLMLLAFITALVGASIWLLAAYGLFNIVRNIIN
jgi:hypothetical protein